MKRSSRPPATQLLFDDQPLESILYDVPGRGPTAASLFLATNGRVAAASRAFHEGDVDGGFEHLRAIIASGEPLSMRAIFTCVNLISSRVPMIPYPILPDDRPYDAILEPLLAASLAHDDDVAGDAGLALYRYHEGCDRFADAARVVRLLLERARRAGKSVREAVLTNNLGFQHLVAGEWADAEPHFIRAEELFMQERLEVEVANARANLLTCQFERAHRQPSRDLERELTRLGKLLRYDWRRRKLLVLRARCVEHRGDLRAAIGLVRQALAAVAKRPTRFRLMDLAYLSHLEGRARERGMLPGEAAGGPRDCA